MLMEGVLEEILSISQSKGVSSCTVCRSEGTTTPAIKWCPSCKATFCAACLKLHNRMPLSQYHNVLELTDDVESELHFMCKTHTEEKATLFCRDCEEPICVSCHRRRHFLCGSVVEIRDMLPEVKSKLRNIKRNLEAQINCRKVKIEKLKSQAKTVLEITSTTETQVKKHSEVAVNVIRTKECDLLGKLKAIKNREIGSQSSDETYEDMTGGRSQNHHMSEAQDLKRAESGEIYESVDTCSTHVIDNNTLSPGEMESAVSQTRITCNTEKIDDAIKESCPGDIITVPVGVADLTSSPVLLETIDTRTSKDKSDPIIKDVLIMKVNNIKTIIVSSWNIMSIKSFYTQHKKQHHSTLELDERPNAITVAEGNQILATAPFSFKIYKVSAYPDLRLSSFISTMVSYFGITYLGQSRIAACVRNSIWDSARESRVDILDMTGNVLTSVQVNGIQSPDFSCLSREGNILLSDVYTNAVVCVSPEGPLLFTSQRGEPAGVAATRSGYVLSVDRCTKRVVQLSSSGEFVREILKPDDGIDKVYGICLDEDESVFVTSGRYIKVFSFE